MASSRQLLLFFLAWLANGAAEDASRPHVHTGKFRKYSPGSPQSAGLRLTKAARSKLLQSTKPKSSVTALPVSPTSPKGTMRCTSIQIVRASQKAIWDTLLDYPRTPEFVGGLSKVEPYRRRPTVTGGNVVSARYTLSIGFYTVKYFIEHKYEPLQKSMVWSLDYSRLSDIFDSVGYWYVEPDGADRSIVYYTQCTLLPAWIPLPLKKTFTTVAMNSATGKLAPACAEAQERSRSKGGLRLPRLPSADSVLKRFSK